jgi:hypothetical protein
MTECCSGTFYGASTRSSQKTPTKLALTQSEALTSPESTGLGNQTLRAAGSMCSALPGTRLSGPALEWPSPGCPG